MGVLRKTFQREVLDKLDASNFTSDDFNVEFGDPQKNEWVVSIRFKYDENYSYTIYKRVSNPAFLIERRPGKFEEEETEGSNKLDYCLGGIDLWCTEVRNELKASQPLYSEVDTLRAIIEEHIKGSSEAEEFSPEDIYNLKHKFDSLEARVERLEKDKIITQSQLEEFKSGMDQVKEDLEFYPKKTWLRTASNKLVKIVTAIGKSKEGRELLIDGARKLLGFE